MSWELWLIKQIQTLKNGFFDIFFWFFSIFSSFLGVIIVFFLFFLLYKKSFSKIFLIAICVSEFVGYFLKTVINRPRPYEVDKQILNSMQTFGKSFPSGHMITATTIVIFLFIMMLQYVKKPTQKIFLSFILFLFITILGVSRMYFGQHYFLDLVAGFFVALVCDVSVFLSCDVLFDKN